MYILSLSETKHNKLRVESNNKTLLTLNYFTCLITHEIPWTTTQNLQKYEKAVCMDFKNHFP